MSMLFTGSCGRCRRACERRRPQPGHPAALLSQRARLPPCGRDEVSGDSLRPLWLAGNLQRKRVKKLLSDLEREHPGVRASILGSMGNVMPEHLLDRRLLRESAAGPLDRRGWLRVTDRVAQLTFPAHANGRANRPCLLSPPFPSFSQAAGRARRDMKTCIVASAEIVPSRSTTPIDAAPHFTAAPAEKCQACARS